MGTERERRCTTGIGHWCTTTLLNVELLTYLGYDPTAATEHSEVATGSALDRLPLIALDKVSALDNERSDLQVLCHTLPKEVGVDGLLGLNFLHGRRLVVDFRRGEIELS